MSGRVSEHRGQIDIAVGRVDADDTARRELGKIEPERLHGEQVHGDGVGYKRIDHDELVEGIGAVLLERESAVAGKQVNGGAALPGVLNKLEKRRPALVG